jgi:prolyl-tRNA synthetase
MKDLYTFDISHEAAIESYRQVAGAYKAVFDKLKLPIIVAEASSGDMGGDHSHEYHLAHAIGSDTVLTCDSCNYAANDEVAVSRPRKPSSGEASGDVRVWQGVTKDRKTLVKAWYRSGSEDGPSRQINIHAVKSLVPDLDGSITSQEVSGAVNDSQPERVLNLIDSSLSSADQLDASEEQDIQQSTINKQEDGSHLNLLTLTDGDGCPRCETGALKTHRALELGHTFYLGTRYSKPLNARVALPQAPKEPVELEMGCYGIGVSRIFAAVAEHMVDDKGLNWPRAIAPFEVVVIPTSGATEDVLSFYDQLAEGSSQGSRLDAVLDDRNQSFGRKMQDAETTGYPVMVILGKQWKAEGLVEVQSRRLDIKEKVSVQDVTPYLQDLLSKL